MAWALGFLPLIQTVVEEVTKVFSTPPPLAHPPHVGVVVSKVLEKTPEEIIREARQSMGVDCVHHYNFVVSGQSGVGKSSFVNGVLSLKGDDACPVGEAETTHNIKSYSGKRWPTLKIWDIPGAGTKLHPAPTYFEDKHLYVFDAILILSCDRFLEVDFQIMQAAHKYGTPCAFVRTKCDIAVKNRAKRDKVNAFEASQRFREEVTRSFCEGLRSSAGLHPELFFISNDFFSYEGDDKPDAYYIYDRKSVDSSLPSMDERPLIAFLGDAAKRRA